MSRLMILVLAGTGIFACAGSRCFSMDRDDVPMTYAGEQAARAEAETSTFYSRPVPSTSSYTPYTSYYPTTAESAVPVQAVTPTPQCSPAPQYYNCGCYRSGYSSGWTPFYGYRSPNY